MIGRRGERGSGISVLAARHDDDDVYRLNLFKEIIIDFNHSLRKLLQAFPTVSLFKLINAAIILAFSSSLVLHNRASHRIIEGIHYGG